jgi:hypothetical protein
MPTPTGTISLSDVNIELGRSSTQTIDMNDSAVRALAGVGGSGTAISMNDLRGKSSLAAVLNNYNANTYSIELVHSQILYGSYCEAYVEIILSSDGSAAYRYGDSVTATTNYTSFTWKTGGGSAGDYYAYMYSPSGDSFTAGSAVAQALALSTSRSWTLLAAANAFSESTLFNSSTLEIRNGSGAVLASKSLSMFAFASGGA